ncbi:hypothetical protein Bbelb_104130 [Branchiostoma belcheri]|nr:hypothetical protein Bbelb_104130 [Branchiostoma belcheri]
MAGVYEQAQPVRNPNCIVEAGHTGPSVRFQTEERTDNRRVLMGEGTQKLTGTPVEVGRKAGEGVILEMSSPRLSEDSYEEAQPVQFQMDGACSSSDDTQDKATLRDQLLRHYKSRSRLCLILTAFCTVIPVIFLTSGLVIGMYVGSQQCRGQTIHKSIQDKSKNAGSVDVTRWVDTKREDTTRPLSMFHEPDSTDAKNCPKGYTKFRGICYKAFNHTTADWRSGLYCLRDAGGTLAMPRDRDINDLLVSLKNSVDRTARFRFGLHDRLWENNWRWVDGRGLGTGEFSDWGPGEPNDFYGNEDCGEYFEALKGNWWNDAPCELRRKFICEVRP